jgi:hypothetical protein
MSAIVLLCFVNAASAQSLPDPDPYLEVSQLSRQQPLLHTSNSSFHSYKTGKDITTPLASFIVGNKEIRYFKAQLKSPYTIQVLIDNKEVGSMTFWGSHGAGIFGYPFPDIADNPSSLTVDKSAQTITLHKPYLTKDNQKATFTCTLRSLGESKVEITWDLGTTENNQPNLSEVSPWFGMKNVYRDNQVIFGSKPYTPASKDTLLAQKGNRVNTTVSGNIHFAPNNPAQSYTVEFDDAKGRVEETLRQHKNHPDQYGITYRPQISNNKIVVDFEEAALASEDTPPAIGGIDFYKYDGTHIPTSPVRNIFNNPTFSQGLHFWIWAGGGAQYDPSLIPRYDIEEKGLFKKNALVINPYQTRSSPLQSFPIALDKGDTYTLSFYAKGDTDGGVTAGLCSAAQAGKFRGKYGTVFGDAGIPESKFKVDSEWKRYSRTFVADEYGIILSLSGYSMGKLYIDGIQLEKSAQPTEFVTAPLEGVLTTMNPDNDIVKGKFMASKFTFYGKAGTKGKAKVSVQNIYRETVDKHTFDINIPENGAQECALPLNEKKVGEGVFVLRTDYTVEGVLPYADFQRLSIMTPLDNTHETKNVFGTLTGVMTRISRGDALAQKFLEWGFGSTSWGVNFTHYEQTVRAGMEKSVNIENFFNTTRFRSSEDPSGKYQELNNYKNWTEVTPELLELVEEAAFEKVSLYDTKQYSTWCFGNEEESSVIANKPDEYMKVIAAAQRGAKRADPNIKFFLTNGTSGYSILRGFYPMESYFKSAEKIGLRFDAVTTHPYGNIDGGRLSRGDLDEETARLIDQMKRYGYGKETPIYYTEGGNATVVEVPEWNTINGDRYQNAKAGYDFGQKEFVHAASMARYWIIVLKYWPHVRSTNIWFSKPYMDYHLTPYILNKVANTLGHHMGYVEYYGDIKPNGKIRGYSFKLKDGSAIAPLWCIDRDVEFGLARGPKVKVKFGQSIEFYDLMGNRRYAKPDKDGITEIQLTPMPLLIKAKDVEKLTKSLQNLEVDDTRSNFVVKFDPTLDGDINADIKNMTNREQKGTIEVAQQVIDYDITPEDKTSIAIPGQTKKVEFGKMYRWQERYTLKPASGKSVTDDWKMDFFYVQKTEGMPNWDTMPAIEITNRFYGRKMIEQISNGLSLPKNDQSARFKMAWDEKNLYLRVEADDDDFIVSKEFWDTKPKAKEMLYHHDGCLEVYFDTGANGRIGSNKSYDDDDYRYDFSIGRSGSSGPGAVYRFREVDHQLADGINMASKQEASEKIKCNFEITQKGYAYTIVFALRYIEPIALRKGFISGFSLYLHDKDGDDEWPPKGLTTATEKGKHSDYNPYLWPLMILAE